MKLIKELVGEYKEHQRKQVEQIPRIHFEYTTLAADNNYPEFEVHVIKGQQVRGGLFELSLSQVIACKSIRFFGSSLHPLSRKKQMLLQATQVTECSHLRNDMADQNFKETRGKI